MVKGNGFQSLRFLPIVENFTAWCLSIQCCEPLISPSKGEFHWKRNCSIEQADIFHANTVCLITLVLMEYGQYFPLGAHCLQQKPHIFTVCWSWLYSVFCESMIHAAACRSKETPFKKLLILSFWVNWLLLLSKAPDCYKILAYWMNLKEISCPNMLSSTWYNRYNSFDPWSYYRTIKIHFKIVITKFSSWHKMKTTLTNPNPWKCLLVL